MSTLAKSQMSKHIRKIKDKKGPPQPQKNTNQRKVGEATAKRMQEKF